MASVDMSILIVCYKSRDLIQQCLEGVYAYTSGCTFEVLIVDCSNDGAVDLVKEKFPAARVIENSENLGFGRGNNLLADHANGTFLVLLNPDVIVSDNAIGLLCQTAMSHPEAGAVGGRSKLPNGMRDPGCRQWIPTISRMLIETFGGAKLLNGCLPEDAKGPAEVETLSGAFMIVRRDAWREANGFDTSFFMYSEELDLCYRLRKNGWTILMTPLAEVIHLVGGGQGQNPNRVRMITTAKMHFLRKYWSRPQAILGGVIIWCHGLIRVLLGTFGGLVLGRDRAFKLRNAYKTIVFQPRNWWFGFQGGPIN